MFISFCTQLKTEEFPGPANADSKANLLSPDRDLSSEPPAATETVGQHTKVPLEYRASGGEAEKKKAGTLGDTPLDQTSSNSGGKGVSTIIPIEPESVQQTAM